VRQGRFVATGLDVVSGAQRWVRDLGVVSGVRPLTGCLPADGAPGTTGGTDGVLLCAVEAPRVADRAGEATTGSGEVSPWPLTELRVTALVADTGEVVGEWRDRSRLLDLARVDDDLVLLTADAAGVARVERRAGATGEVRWGRTGTEPLRLRQGAAARPSVQVSTSFVLVQAWSAIVLDAQDGSEVVAPPAGRVVIGALSGDRVAVWSSGAGGRVYDAEGTELFRTPTLFPPLAASDGSAPEVLVLDEGGSVVGRSLPDGAELWRLDTYRSVRLVAGGSVVLVGVDGYQVVDARTGEPRWELPYRELMWWAPISDGSLVLGPGRTATGAPTVEARRLDDGTVAWTLPLDPGVRAVSAVGGHLVVRTRDELVMLG
jgi:outer membrane protein assembly factor BamB